MPSSGVRDLSGVDVPLCSACPGLSTGEATDSERKRVGGGGAGPRELPLGAVDGRTVVLRGVSLLEGSERGGVGDVGDGVAGC